MLPDKPMRFVNNRQLCDQQYSDAIRQLGFKEGYKVGIKEVGSQLRARIGGIDEFTDWSDEGLRQFRKNILSVVEAFLEERGITEEAR